ncbi:MAG: bifunctional alpha,alpha-trehalose-phosphate synthase (UDP-forming)/trehalose-phosphatase [Deltaproteobacteria bacterium]|nr:bifunctional alpha,alpha-trehalose-phosphate synthase (UDP-forming)/trehalose-phosphatase [Deltaproteobacteria bacterium]
MSLNSNSRLLMVSNRLPISVVRHKDGVRFLPSVGGLATGLRSFYQAYHGQWIGWPGLEDEEISGSEARVISKRLGFEGCFPVILTRLELEKYYHGFCNNVIWPLFHYFTDFVVYDKDYWHYYQEVNQTFCQVVLETAKPQDVIWVHDYHLMLLPQMIRRQMPQATIAFFLHIPFPSFEIFRQLPWREEILSGLLGSDLVGFHTYDYVREFLESVRRIMGHEHALGQLSVEDRMVKVDAFPMGIDYDRFAEATEQTEVKKEVADIGRETVDRRLILSIDRLDYSKGLLQRLEAFRLFLENNPDQKGKVTLVLLVVPSRTEVERYANLKKQIDELVGQINGRFGSIGWAPIWYLYRSLPFEKLVALYHKADVALVTPLRDGMNLVAKEFIATKTDGQGALVLSEMAGAAREMGEAIMVNPNNVNQVAEAIDKALSMDPEEKTRRVRAMQDRLQRYDVISWAEDFLAGVAQIKKIQQGYAVRRLTSEGQQELIEDYVASQHRLFLFDYDGTLAPFADRPEMARPDEDLLDLLKTLPANGANKVVIISNRDRNTMERWFGGFRMDLSSEHGIWMKEWGEDWELVESVQDEWKDQIRPIMEYYVDRTPGSFIEEKDFSLVWHHRTAQPELGQVRSLELKDTLLQMTGTLDLEVQEGNKIILVKNAGVHKGRAAGRWAYNNDWDFILCAGDDWTDEDMFAVLPAEAYSLRVGLKVSRARFNLPSPQDVRHLLKALVTAEQAQSRLHK